MREGVTSLGVSLSSPWSSAFCFGVVRITRSCRTGLRTCYDWRGFDVYPRISADSCGPKINHWLPGVKLRTQFHCRLQPFVSLGIELFLSARTQRLSVNNRMSFGTRLYHHLPLFLLMTALQTTVYLLFIAALAPISELFLLTLMSDGVIQPSSTVFHSSNLSIFPSSFHEPLPSVCVS